MEVSVDCELTKIEAGRAGTLYSIKLNGSKKSEFDLFAENSEFQQNEDFREALAFLEIMVEKKGFEPRYFKVSEGSYTDSLVALSRGNIRLYGLRWSKLLLIVGNGGYKGTQCYQDDPILDRATKVLMAVDKEVLELYRSGRVVIDHDKGEITGELQFVITIKE